MSIDVRDQKLVCNRCGLTTNFSYFARHEGWGSLQVAESFRDNDVVKHNDTCPPCTSKAMRVFEDFFAEMKPERLP